MQTQPSTLQMLKELKEVNGRFNTVERAAPGKSRRAQIQQQALLDLSMRLQISLEVDWLIDQFMQYLHTYLLFDGYQYSLSAVQKNITQGRQQGHSHLRGGTSVAASLSGAPMVTSAVTCWPRGRGTR